MTALYSIATTILGVEGDPFAVIADDTTAHYVFPDGTRDDGEGRDDWRIQHLTAVAPAAPTTADAWLALATNNIGYFVFTAPVEAASMDEAQTGAVAALALIAEGPDLWAPPTSRQERVAFQARAADEWAQQFPAQADGAPGTGESDLVLAQLMTPPVDPSEQHTWLPMALGDFECGFCDKPAEDAIHATQADTITRGSNKGVSRG